MNNRVYINKLYFYFVIIAFLFPRGFSEISDIYHTLSSLLVWIAVFFILLSESKYFCNYYRITGKNIFISLYFILAIIFTLYNRGNITSGLQQVFAFPFLCLFLISNMQRSCKELLEIIISVLVVEYVVNFVFVLSGFDFGGHITFLGHVQMISQLGLLAVFIAVLYMMLFQNYNKKVVFLIVIALFTMFTTDASSAFIAALGLCITYMIYKGKLYDLFCLKIEIYYIGLIIFNLLIIYLTTINRNIIPKLDFSGRRFVWDEAITKIVQKPILGYGIDGVLLHPFWTKWTGGGFNYAHNQILQNMLDGGIVLTVVFWVMIYLCIKNINKIKKKKYKVLFTATVILLLFLMIFDSMTLYCYMYYILILIYVFPKIECFIIKERK